MDSEKLEMILQPELNANLFDNISFTGIFRIRADMNDNLEPGKQAQSSISPLSRRILISENVDAELREFYFDSFSNDTAIRLGKQQVVWGQADGLKVLDVINPQSFREFILDEFVDSRIPLWMINTETSLGNDTQLQILWIPDTTYQYLPAGGSYTFTTSRLIPQAPEGYDVVLNKENRPKNLFNDSDIGVKLSSFYKGWDVTFNYLYHYKDSAVLYRSITANTVTINPEYERTHLIGGTLSNAFGDYTLRSEFGYSTDNYYVTHNTSSINGIEKSEEASFVIGLDYSGLTDSFLSIQIFQSLLIDNVKSLSRSKVENTITFLAERTFVNETFKFETLLIHSMDDGDGVIRSKLKYEYLDNINFWLGANIFYGHSDGFYGQFNNRDNVNLGFEWGF